VEIHKRFRERSGSGHEKLVGEFKLRSTLDYRFFMVHPAVIFVYYMGLFTFVFLFTHPLYMLTVMICSLSLALYYNGYLASRGTFKAALLIGTFMLVLNPLTSHRGAHMLFYLGGNPVTLEGIAYGAYNFILIITLLATFLSFNRLIDSERFLFLFSRVAPKTAFITNMTMRYIWLYRSRAGELSDVQKTRGGAEQKKGKIAGIKKAGMLLSALVSWSLEEGMKTAQVLKAKEYGRRGRSNYVLYKFTLADGLFLAIVLFLFVMLVAAGISGFGKYAIYPRLKLPAMAPMEWFLYAALAFYLFLPLIMEGYTAVRRMMTRASCGIS
jgi:energy-coupling factor transport system permease protein